MDKEILLYNTKENGHLKIINNSLISLIKEMYYPENLGVTKVNKDMLENLDISSIITTLIQMKMAELKKIENDKTRPIVLIPILNFQNDIDKIKEKVKDDKERSILLGKNTLKNLFELNIYINRFCTINCAFCKSYFKQFECCTGNPDETEELSINVFKNIINQIKYSSVNKINILGGNTMLS